MQITKEYKFYYGHRNQLLLDKCVRPHGHDAHIYITFNVVRKGSISTLFGDFDSQIEPFFKNLFDHRFLMDIKDDLLPYLQLYEKEKESDLGLKIIPFPTSVENVSFFLFHEIFTKFGFDIDSIKFQETRSSTLSYFKSDYEEDLKSELLEEYNNLLTLLEQKTKEPKEEFFLSPFDYLGRAIGFDEGGALKDKARELNIPYKKREISNSSYQGPVTLYPESFLKNYYKH